MRRAYMHSQWVDPAAVLEAEEIEAGLSNVLGDGIIEEATPEDVESWLGEAMSQLTPLERESVGNALRDLGRWARNQSAIRDIAGKALPTVGTIVGTAYGGPVGAAVGGQLGQIAGQAVAGRKPSTEPPSMPPTEPTQPTGAAPGGATVSGSQAAGQLAHLIQNPAFLTSLLALAMGRHGRASVPVGERGTEVPHGAFMNLLSSLAGRAAQEAEMLSMPDESEETAPSYLLDSEGNFLCDPAVPAQRAGVLLRLLEQEDEPLPTHEEVSEHDPVVALESWEEALHEAFDIHEWEGNW